MSYIKSAAVYGAKMLALWLIIAYALYCTKIFHKRVTIEFSDENLSSAVLYENI